MLFITSVFAACNFSEKPELKGTPLARVGEKYLYFDDIKDIIPQNISKYDSIAFLKNFINKWIKKQAILDKANITLTEKQKDISKQLEEYKNVVLMNKYEQIVINQKLDTNILNSEIENYYEAHKSELKLRENIVNPLFVRIPKSAQNLNQVKIWYKSSNENDIDKLVKLSYKSRGDFFYEEHEWYSFSSFFKKIPVETGPSDELFLRTNKYIEFNDSLDYYFVNIKAFRLKNDEAPLDYVKSEIKSIILNKRKINLITEIENQLFNDVISDSKAEILSKEILNFSDTGASSKNLKYSVSQKK